MKKISSKPADALPRIDFQKILYESGNASEMIRDLLVLKAKLEADKNPEKIDTVIAELKCKFYFSPGVLSYSNAGTVIDQALRTILLSFNPPRTLQDVYKDQLFENDDGVLIRNDGICKIQLSDHAGVLKENPFMLELFNSYIRATGEFTQHSFLYKAHIVVDQDIMAISIDQGAHKEQISVFAPKDLSGFACAYCHFERSEPGKENNRIKYVEEVITHSGLNAIVEKEGRQVRVFGFLGSCTPYKPLERIFLLGRLSRSVKDLDLVLKDRYFTNFAVALFDSGITNMDYFLFHFSMIGKRNPGKITQLNSFENEELDAYEILLQEINKYHIPKERLKLLEEGKKLNFEILQEAIELMDKATPFDFSKNAIRRYGIIAGKLLRMGEICDLICCPLAIGFSDYSQMVKRVLKKFEKMMEFKFYEQRLGPQEQKIISLMFSDKGGELSLSDVESIEEAVRFLHSVLVTGMHSMLIGSDVITDNKTQKRIEVITKLSIDAEKIVLIFANKQAKKAKTFGIFRDCVERLARSVKMQFEYRNATAIFSKNRADISMPFGKHYAEITVDMDDLNNSYFLKLGYVESQARGFQLRKRYVIKVLEALGFKINT